MRPSPTSGSLPTSFASNNARQSTAFSKHTAPSFESVQIRSFFVTCRLYGMYIQSTSLIKAPTTRVSSRAQLVVFHSKFSNLTRQMFTPIFQQRQRSRVSSFRSHICAQIHTKSSFGIFYQNDNSRTRAPLDPQESLRTTLQSQ